MYLEFDILIELSEILRVHISIMSIIDPLTCGFVKVAVYTLLSNPTKLKKNENEKFTEFKSRDYKDRYNKFNEIFGHSENFKVQYQHFTTNFNKIKDNIKLLAKNNSSIKNQVLKVFSIEKWNNLSNEEKNVHSVYDCQACSINDSYRTFLAKFPNKSKKGRNKAEASGLNSVLSTVLVDTTNQIVNEYNKQYTKVFGKSFTEAHELVIKNSHLKEKENRSDIEKKAMKKMSKNISEQWAETSVERYRLIFAKQVIL